MAALALAACSSPAGATWEGGKSPSGAPLSGSTAPGDALTITAPANGATDVAAGTEIALSGAASGATVTVTDDAGNTVDGAPGYDPNTWVPKSELSFGTHYTAKVTSGGSTSTVSFTTMGQPDSSKLVRVQSFMGDGQVFGIAMPVVLTLNHDVAPDQRAAVQKRLSVTSTPAQTGSWNWISGHEIHYRPQSYWQAGTKLFVNVQTGGVPFGDGYYGGDDLTVDASIATHSLTIVTDDKTHMMQVYRDGKVIKTIPVALGLKAHPSSSGTMVIMTRKPSEIFDSSLGTGGIPVNAPGGYRVLVYYTERLTWDGQFIHAAPWSVAEQGHRDASHGCTNVSTANAKWIYENSHIGDPVTVKNTGTPVAWGDGWTDWSVDWATYLKGSALPA